MAVRFPVTPEKSAALIARMQGLSVHEADLDETFVRSGGKGGQNVNKVATCVMLLHRPTGTQVKCQKDRSQGLNRYYARVWLCDAIEKRAAHGAGGATAIISRAERDAEKRRKQKARRSRRTRHKLEGNAAPGNAKASTLVSADAESAAEDDYDWPYLGRET